MVILDRLPFEFASLQQRLDIRISLYLASFTIFNMIQVQPHGAAVRLLPDILKSLIQYQTPLFQIDGRNMLQNDFYLHLYFSIISIRPYRI